MTTPTRHDPTKVLMGSHGSSDFQASNFPGFDPELAPAGIAVTVAGTGEPIVGVSLGRSLSDHKVASVCRAGNQVPLQLEGFAFLEQADLTFFTLRNVAVAIEFLDTETAGAETVDVTGDDDAGYVISVGMEDGVSTATQVKAALDGNEDAAALIETVITGTAGDPQADFAEDDIDGAIAVIGQAVEILDATGKGFPGGDVPTAGVYETGVLTGIMEDGTEVPAALIDMPGGL